jgi:hypothetical protein
MADPPQYPLVKAQLQIEGGDKLDCWFNPKDYTIAKQNSYNFPKVTGSSLPTGSFTGGQPRTLTLNLLFDGTDTKGWTAKGGSMDVSAVTDKLFKAMEVSQGLAGGSSKNTGRPPQITFIWGKTVSFQAFATQLSVQYTLFNPSDGRPLRANVTLNLTQAAPQMDNSSQGGTSAGQNPTTRATPGLGAHTVRDGDSLASIAYQHYRDPTRWRAIAEANDIDDPLRLKRGAILSIPRIEE